MTSFRSWTTENVGDWFLTMKSRQHDFVDNITEAVTQFNALISIKILYFTYKILRNM